VSAWLVFVAGNGRALHLGRSWLDGSRGDRRMGQMKWDGWHVRIQDTKPDVGVACMLDGLDT
jgi:hypothetical protein